MKSNLRLTIVLIGGLFLCLGALISCHNRGELQVINKNFEEEIEQQQNLVFSFNKEIYPDTLLGAWDSSAYIDFSPAVKGLFKWNSANELVFSPAQGFAPGADYTAHLTKLLVSHSKKKYSISGEPVTFHTAPLRVNATHLSWTRGKNLTNVMVQMDMSFNYEVNLGEAANRLKLSANGNPVNITNVNSGNGKVLSLQFMPVNDKDEETPLNITLGKGIAVGKSLYISASDTSYAISIPSRYNLTVTGVAAQHTGNDGIITVSTSQPVLEKDLKSQVVLEPAVPFEVTINEGGFTITSSQLSATQTYQLNIAAKLEGAFGGKMKQEYSEQVTFGKLKPAVTFMNSKGMYMSGAGFKNLAVNIVNIAEVEVTVIKVYENNIEQFMHHGESFDYHYDADDGDGEDFKYYDTENMGDVIYTKSYETNKLPRQNSARLLHLDFQDKIKNYNGVYVIRIQSKEHNWIQQSKILSISDIGLIARQEKDNTYVFANSIKNATPLRGVNISLFSTNNQRLLTAVTDGDGVAIFKGISEQSPGFKVGMVTAKQNDEFSFILFEKAQIGTSRFDVGGRRPNETGIIAMIYPERNLYRPGETIHVNTILRDERWGIQTDAPIKIKLTMPNGKEFATVRKILNEQGSAEATFSPPPTAMTGTYTVQVYTGNDVLLNSYEISVEEFMPDRMKVGLKLDKADYKAGEEVTAIIQADNLFGTPAAGRNYQCELNLSKGTFSTDKFPDYNFFLHNEFNFNTDMREGKTDDKGAGVQTWRLDKSLAEAGLVNGNIMASVFDETGRPVHRYAKFTVYTQQVFAGIKCNEDYVSSRQPVTMGLVATDKSGSAMDATAHVVLVRKEWHTVIQQNGSSYRYVSRSEEKIISESNIRITGAGTHYTVIPQESGEYEVRVFVNGSNNYVSKTLYAYGWGDTQYTSFEVNNEGNVEIKADKKKFELGENVSLLFTTPFEGRMLVTLERDHVINYYYLNTKNKSASLSFKAGEEHLPNVYVTATLFRPMGGDDMPLTVAHGFKSVTVESKSALLPVSISVAEKSRSKTKQTINVKTAPGAFVTIAAVDEGILQVKNFETPDAYKYFYQKVALTVNSYDIYPWLLPEIKSTLSSTGGDGADKSKLRLNPMFVNRVKNVSFWSGILQADGSGNVKYEIDIPQFSGDMRVMALAYKGKAFGAADKHMKVADPVIVSTALPRFLSPKDEVVMPVSLSNTTNKSAMAVISVKLEGPLGIKGTESQTVDIPANREQRVVFNIYAHPAIGIGKVTVTVKAMNESFINETELSIRPPASLQKLTGSGMAAQNATTPLSFMSSFEPTSVSGKLLIGKSPLTRFSKQIDDLVRYPYGCVEQTISAAFPQLYYADLVKSLNGGTSTLNPAYNVQQAINKLQSMQQSDGGLSYWPGGAEESWWGSVYAAHFLMEAHKAGYEVNANTLDRLQQYMKFRLYKKELSTFYYNGTEKKEVAPEEVPYSLYILAIAGQSQQATMNYYKAHRELLTLDGKYMLAAAYAMSGQPTQAKEVLPPAFAGEVANHSFSGSFYSYIRDEALSLDVLMDIDPNNAQVGIMARQLSDDIAKEKYLNTQEKAFSMLALGKIAKLANQTTSTASVLSRGKAIGNTAGQALSIDLKPYLNQALSVQVKGKGGYYYFWEVDGITNDGSYKEEDSYLRVRRTFYNREGGVISGNTFRQNDLVVVGISIDGQNGKDINNVAITDMLPAGFEIENTRLSEMPAMKWIKQEKKPDYMDIRDDRINMFTTVSEKRREFYYMVRAVSPGVYQLGPVQADAMYDGNYHSYNGGGVVRITEK
jgi:uncharacterized protein YfaS (alpha-2-macroglobulin family)